MTIRKALAIIGLAIGLVLAHGAPAGALEGNDPVTDYANYPNTLQAKAGPGCDGGGLFRSEMFSLNGGTPVHDPKDLPEFNEGDVLVMTWNDNTPQCQGSAVSLDVKVSQKPTFDPEDDQPARLPFTYDFLTGGPGSLTYVFPSLAEFGLGCFYQLDAIVGIPLAIVGPSGSDYTAGIGNRPLDGRTMLINFRNGGYSTCLAQGTTTTTEAPTTTTTAPEVTTTTGPALDATTTTVAPATTAPAVDSTPTTAQNVTPTAQTALVTQGDSAVIQTRAVPSLAVTGPDGSVPGAIIGACAILSGLLLILICRHKRPTEEINDAR